MNSEEVANRLADEKSPYLLQHAHNPVNWYPWSEEAFSKARSEDKPIFLSIGYSTCHWCHVMERESFEDNEVASVLNEKYISIKVDREERPDIDNIYMEVCQALTGSGGWPLTILMTPDMKPFYAGTYFPKISYGNHNGIMELLNKAYDKWKENKSEILNSAEEITRIIREYRDDNPHQEIDKQIFEKAFNTLEMSFDKNYGGFGSQPKFPSPHQLLYLLRYGIYNNVQKAIDMVEKTLVSMYKGGIFDHIGYGFSRYSVDKKWLVPHFEKMLYDNAFLTIAYTELYQVTHKKLYKEIAEKIIKFVLSEMVSPDGGFYTAIDADSEGVEGKFYLWTKTEITNILPNDDAKFICDYFNITETGNFENANILNLLHHKDNEFTNIDQDKLEEIRVKLFNEREKRVHPYKDDKILTSTNGMMIAALTIAGKVFDNKFYIFEAEKAVSFIIDNLITKDSRILARYRDGEAKYLGYLDDYGYFIWGLIELFIATGKCDYIERAQDINTRMLDLFRDSDKGGLYQTGNDSDELIMKTKEIYDGAIPSGNSIVTMNLIRLAEITDDIYQNTIAQKQIEYFAGKINDSPTSHTFMLSSYMFYKVPKTKIVLVSTKDSPSLKEVLALINDKYLPFTTTVTLFKEDVSKKNDLFLGYRSHSEEIACFICSNYQCNEPLYNKQEIISEITKLSDIKE